MIIIPITLVTLTKNNKYKTHQAAPTLHFHHRGRGRRESTPKHSSLGRGRTRGPEDVPGALSTTWRCYSWARASRTCVSPVPLRVVNHNHTLIACDFRNQMSIYSCTAFIFPFIYFFQGLIFSDQAHVSCYAETYDLRIRKSIKYNVKIRQITVHKYNKVNKK